MSLFGDCHLVCLHREVHAPLMCCDGVILVRWVSSAHYFVHFVRLSLPARETDALGGWLACWRSASDLLAGRCWIKGTINKQQTRNQYEAVLDVWVVWYANIIGCKWWSDSRSIGLAASCVIDRINNKLLIATRELTRHYCGNAQEIDWMNPLLSVDSIWAERECVDG